MVTLFHPLAGSINGVCLLNVLLGIFLVSAISWTSWLGYESATGWVAVMGASVIFGSTGIPFKTPSLKGVKTDPIVFALFAGFGIFLVSLPLQVFLWFQFGSKQKQFDKWSILGSVDILVTTFLAFQTVQCLGYAKGPAIWASVGMIFSFLIGAIVFRETITNVISAILSVPSLIAGMLLIISCQTTKESDVEYSTLSVDDESPSTAQESTSEIELNEVDRTEVPSESGPNSEDGNSNRTKNTSNNTPAEGVHTERVLWGILLGVITGLVDGSLMVPFKLTKSSTNFETYQYLASFGMSSLITTPIIFALYYVYLRFNNKSDGPPISMDQMRLSMIPGVLNGILWGLANSMSVTATYHLSMRIAFPLTQTCVLFATCWGIFYFHEIEKSRETLIKLTSGLGFFMLGTLLLAESSS